MVLWQQLLRELLKEVKKYLNKALDINPNNILANLSKGIWHAEIINQAGKTLAGAVYGAKIEKAVYHFFDKVETHRNSNEIGVLFELAYGYSLLNEGVYFKKSKVLIERLLKKKFHQIWIVFIKKALLLLEILLLS